MNLHTRKSHGVTWKEAEVMTGTSCCLLPPSSSSLRKELVAKLEPNSTLLPAKVEFTILPNEIQEKEEASRPLLGQKGAFSESNSALEHRETISGSAYR